jgi:hypothetical protein
MCQIEFHLAEEMLGDIPHPYAASRHIPDWFRNMAMDFELGGTLKRCPPFLTAMMAGYLIPAPGDLRLTMNAAGELSAAGKLHFVSSHFPQQYAGAPFATRTVVKFENPWIIVTPPEFFCLITAPINRFEMPFLPLAGIVETGTYYKEVQLPMACLMQPGQTFDLPRGAPMIQVIPFRRDEWLSLTAPLDRARRAEQQAKFDANKHTYKEEFWKKIQFS